MVLSKVLYIFGKFKENRIYGLPFGVHGQLLFFFNNSVLTCFYCIVSTSTFIRILFSVFSMKTALHRLRRVGLSFCRLLMTECRNLCLILTQSHNKQLVHLISKYWNALVMISLSDVLYGGMEVNRNALKC